MIETTEAAVAADTAPSDAHDDTDSSRPRISKWHAVVHDSATGSHTLITHDYKNELVKALNGIGQARIITVFYGRVIETKQKVTF